MRLNLTLLLLQILQKIFIAYKDCPNAFFYKFDSIRRLNEEPKVRLEITRARLREYYGELVGINQASVLADTKFCHRARCAARTKDSAGELTGGQVGPR